MKNFKSHFVLDNRQRSGILLLALILVGLLAVYNWIDFTPEYSINYEEIQRYQKQIDSLKRQKIAKQAPKIYPFNPNFITDYKGYTLGMSVEEIDRLLRFRESDKWINSTQDFQKVTGVSDSLLAAISPYFKFPEWVTNPKPKRKFKSTNKTYSQKKDLNTATWAELATIPEIDEAQVSAILKYRKRLKGFVDDNQLFEVYGLENKWVYKIKDHFTVKQKPNIQPLSVNTATASDLATNPYINFDLARDIVDYRILNEGIKDLDELLKIEGMTSYKLARIKLYLSTSQ